MSEAPLPEIRASDADRERVAEQLRLAAGDGQLTVNELDERLDAAYAARTRADLVPLTADLQPAHGSSPARVGADRQAGGVTVRRGPGGARWLIAIMGGCDRKGRWRLREQVTSINFMGGSNLDLNDAELASDRVELTVVSFMGGAEIRLPENLAVEVSEFAFMGGNSVDVGDVRRASAGPVLHLRLWSVMGGADVKRGRKRSRKERQRVDAERWHRLGH